MTIRNVRPSWAEVFVNHSGSDAPHERAIGTGPRSRLGSLTIKLLARVAGEAVPVLTIEAVAMPDGSKTAITVREHGAGDGGLIYRKVVDQ